MMKRICFFLALLLCLSVVTIFPSIALADQTNTVIGTPSGTYKDYRIPGIVVTQNDTVLAGWEYRAKIDEDRKGIDIKILRSENGAESFETVLEVTHTEEDGFTNPMLIVGNDGTIHLIYAQNTGNKGVWYRYSTKEQDGKSWSEPVDISSCLRQTELGWNMVNFGPGHGICLKNGKNAGRLLLPVWCHYNNTYYVYTVYSDDNGVTWQMGDVVEGLYNEAMIAELSNGDVLLNARQYGYSYDNASETYKPATQADAYRHVAFSATGIDSWSEVRKDTDLPDPACQGSMISTTINGKHAILFTNCASQSTRSYLTVRCSFDNAKSWVDKKVLIDLTGGYSDIAVDRNGKAYVLHERWGGESVGHQMLLYRFDLNATFSSYVDSTVDFEGAGTEASPYLLENMGDLNTLQNSESSYENQFFKLCFDPVFQFDDENWNGIGSKTPFAGSFDGNGHTVKDLFGDFFKNVSDSFNVQNVSYETRVFGTKICYQVKDHEEFWVRFLAELRCEPDLLSEAGFEYEINYGDRTETYQVSCREVYMKLLANGEDFLPNEGKYFLLHGIKEIPEDKPVSFMIRSYAITKSNEVYYGSKDYFTFVANRKTVDMILGNGNCTYQEWSTIFQ